MIAEELRYKSSVDLTWPLFGDVVFQASGKAKPLIAIVHGYQGNRKDVAQDLKDLAKRGLFCIGPDMRGCGDSAGRWDSGGLDVHDIVDGLLAVIEKYPGEVDRNNINIVGYSGGGGNCLAAVTRFPDLFHVGASFFGISDYALWFETMGRPDCNKLMAQTLGGTPAQCPEIYAARNATLAAGNCPATRLHIFWDEEEQDCPPILNEKFLDAYHAAGGRNAVAHVSRITDDARWHHGYRTSNPMLAKADEIFLQSIFSPVDDLALPDSGVLTVCGYLVTGHFQVFVEDGQRGVVKIRYELSGAKPRITVIDNPRNYNVHVSLDTPLGCLTHRR